MTSSPSRGRFLALLAALLGWMFDGMEMGLFPLTAKDALAELLALPKDHVDVGSPLSAPLDLTSLRSYASVVVVDVAANQFAPGQLRVGEDLLLGFGQLAFVACADHGDGTRLGKLDGRCEADAG